MTEPPARRKHASDDPEYYRGWQEAMDWAIETARHLALEAYKDFVIARTARDVRRAALMATRSRTADNVAVRLERRRLGPIPHASIHPSDTPSEASPYKED